MFQSPHFLVPVKVTADVPPSLSMAVNLATAVGGRVSLLHVRRPSWPKYEGLDADHYLYAVLDQPEAERRERQARRHMERLLAAVPLNLHAALRLRALLREGEVIEEIVRTARQESATTILLDAAPRRWWQLHQRLTDGVLRAAPCQVLLVGQPAAPTRAQPQVKKLADDADGSRFGRSAWRQSRVANGAEAREKYAE